MKELADSAEFKNEEIQTNENPLQSNDNDAKIPAKSKSLNNTEKEYIIIDMPEHNTGQMGGTMRLGKKKTFFQKKHLDKSILCKSFSHVMKYNAVFKFYSYSSLPLIAFFR